MNSIDYKDYPAVSSWPDLEVLRSWHKEYITADDKDFYGDSNFMRAVESDPLDTDEIEKQVHRLMSTAHTRVTEKFCEKCHHALEHWPPVFNPQTGSKATVVRLLTTTEVEAATRNGCHFCAFLLCRLRVRGWLDVFRKIERRLQILGDDGEASLSVQQWEVRCNNNQPLWVNFPGHVATYFNTTHAAQTRLESHVMSSASKLWEQTLDPLDLVKIWLANCSNSRGVCSSRKTHGKPTRLISIGHDGVRLTLAKDWEGTKPYATLSYCWGNAEFIKLTSDNFGSFLNAIPQGQLPRTIQDAVHIVRRIGLEFIWVDALCIIQDQLEDWEYEASCMSDVYGGAYVNLAASSARDVHGGCFAESQNYSGGFCARVTNLSDGPDENPAARCFYSREVYKESCLNNHLATRAWTLQEKLLTSRTIYFGDHGLFWECRSGIASEYLPDWIPGAVCNDRLVRPEHVAWDWDRIVTQYSAADLTISTDRLPALSGIAERQSAITGDDYLAGMWRKDLELQLLWSPFKAKSQRPDWRSPSWSWASVDGAKHYPRVYHWYYHEDRTKKEDREKTFDIHQYIRVLTAWTILSGLDPHGNVKDGEIRIRVSALIRGLFQSTYEIPNKITPFASYVLLDAGTRPCPIYTDCLGDESAIAESDNIFLLPITSGQTISKPVCKEAAGIILRRHGHCKGHFQRLGSFEFDTKRRLKEELDDEEVERQRDYYEFMAVLDKVGTAVAKDECLEEVENSEFPAARYVLVIK